MGETNDAVRSQYLSFSLRETEYAVGILKVKEILQYEQTTRVPSTPRSIRGVINLRGQVVPVIDLAAKFGLGETDPSRLTCILIVEAQLDGASTVVGIMADSVREVIELGADDIEPTPAFGTQVRVDFLLGVGKMAKRFVLLLDLDRVISADEKEFAREMSRRRRCPTRPPRRRRAPSWSRRRVPEGDLEDTGGGGSERKRLAATAPKVPAALAVSDRDFLRFQALIHREAGIWLAPVKKALLVGRLAQRLRELGLDSYGDYYERVGGGRGGADPHARLHLHERDALLPRAAPLRVPRRAGVPGVARRGRRGAAPAARSACGARRARPGRSPTRSRWSLLAAFPVRLGARGARERPLHEGARPRRARGCGRSRSRSEIPADAPEGVHAEGRSARRRGS